MSARAASDAPLPEDLDLAIETLRHLASGLPPELAEVLIAGVELLTMERAACRAP
jgi:hypothetical protein